MGKFLVILAILLTAVSAGLGYLNQVKFAEVKKRAADAETTVSQTKTQLAKAQGDLKTAAQNLSSTVTEKDQLTSRLSGVQICRQKLRNWSRRARQVLPARPKGEVTNRPRLPNSKP